MRLWNKAPAIWFPWRLGTVIGIVDCRCGRLGAEVISLRCSTDRFEPVAREV